MKLFNKSIIGLLIRVVLFTAFITACPTKPVIKIITPDPVDIPTVKFTDPINLSMDVPINSDIIAIFNQEMDSTTISATTVTLMQGTNIIPCSLSYADKIVIINPTSDLQSSADYTAKITTDVKDLIGTKLASDYIWSFRTGVAVDSTAPLVSSTIPADQAIDVVLNSNIAVTFNEGLNPKTVSSANFILSKNGVIIPAVISYGRNITIINPVDNLSASSEYILSVKIGVKDLAGNSLEDDYDFSFTTGTTTAVGPSPVILGTAGDFVILSKAGISNTGNTSIVGSIGVSPAAATYLTGFDLDMDPSNTFSNSIYVSEKVYAANYTAPTPSYMTVSISNMEASYTDAAGRAIPTDTELGAGDISGLTIAPGLYKWGTGVLVASDVTFDGGPDDVWVFQISGGLTLSSAVRVHLTGGAMAKNIFWQVFGAVTLNTTSHLEGIVLSQTEITLATGSTVNGRLLSQTAVTLDACTITTPAQ